MDVPDWMVAEMCAVLRRRMEAARAMLGSASDQEIEAMADALNRAMADDPDYLPLKRI